MPATARTTFRLALLATLLSGSPALLSGQAAGAEGRDLPPALVPFEYLIGRWKGQGVPRDNPSQRFRGWTETHTWAWVFVGGKPVAMSVAIEGGKVFSQGTLRYEPAGKHYSLDARESGEPARTVRFAGTLDSSGKVLTVERTERGGIQRLTFAE